MITKICKKCGKELPIEEFAKNPGSKDGHINTCKRCRNGFPKEEILYCPVCEKKLPYYNFNTGRGPTGRNWLCSDCESKYPLEWKLSKFRRKHDPAFRKRQDEIDRKSRIKNFARGMWRAAKRRAKLKNIEFTIDPSDIIIPDKCPLLEVPFVYGEGHNDDYTPSLDRIDNEKGYIKGNIQVISMKANSMKNSASLEELQTFCKNILRYSPNNNKKEVIE